MISDSPLDIIASAINQGPASAAMILQGCEIGLIVMVKLFMALLVTLSSNFIPNFADILEMKKQGRIDAFSPPRENETLPERGIDLLFDGFSKWDAQYFLFVSQYGYAAESHFAFFPFLPTILGFYSHFMGLLLPKALSSYHLALVGGVSLNFFLGIVNCELIAQFTFLLTNDFLLSRVASVLFLLNPASIFFCAVYTESLYFFLVALGLISLLQNKGVSVKVVLFSGLFFHLATWTRANGVVNAGFYLFELSVLLYSTLKSKRVSLNLVTNCFLLIFSSVATILPFFGFQFYAYRLFCIGSHEVPVLDGRVKSYLGNSSKSEEWCSSWPYMVYPYIQKHYWNNGFLQYYTWNNIPNFLLALPILMLVPYLLIKRSRKFLTDVGKLLSNDEHISRDTICSIACYVQLGILYMFALMFMNIQVTTRFLISSSPFLTVLIADEFCEAFRAPKPSSSQKDLHRAWLEFSYGPCFNFTANFLSHLIRYLISELPNFNLTKKLMFYWFMIYNILGVVLFPNRLPWT